LKYPFFQKGDHRIRLHGIRRKKERVYLEIKDLIDKGTTSITELGSRLGKSTRQIRRYIKDMARLGMIKLDPETGRLVKKRLTDCELLSKDEFTKITEIEKWINDCIARDVQPSTISQYVKCLKSILTTTKTIPKDVVKSKKDAVEIWAKFMVEFRKQNPARGTQYYRVSFKNFLSSFEITFAPREGKMYGLSSSHDRYGAYAGVSLSQELTKKIGNMILANDDLQLYTWWRIGLRTGARSKAISTMVWERIYFDEKNEDGSQSFKLEQHETKDARGHYHIGQNGEWKTKYPPLDLRKLLLKWKKESGINSRFLWFKDSLTDAQNKRNAERVKERVVKKLRMYFEKIADKVDPLTREYMFKKPGHLMRHILAQQMRDAGLTNDEIADSFGWRSPDIVGTWYTKTSEKKRKELGMRCSKVIF
jgi:DNA-binding transcriptional regulator YhcF (GntR family)